MSTPNANIPEKVYSALKKHYSLKSDKALADFLSVDYRTLAAWKSRGKIAKVDQFINKCRGINIDFLKTGEGEMFVTPITGTSRERLSFSESSHQAVELTPEELEMIRIARECPEAISVVRLMGEMDRDAQKAIQARAEEKKLLQDLMKERLERKAG